MYFAHLLRKPQDALSLDMFGPPSYAIKVQEEASAPPAVVPADRGPTQHWHHHLDTFGVEDLDLSVQKTATATVKKTSHQSRL